MTLGFIGNEWARAIFSHGEFGVYVFFVISGFIIPWSMQKNGYRLNSFFKYILKRIVRLDPPYIVSILLVILFIVVKPYLGFEPDVRDHISGTQIVLHLGYLVNFFPEYEWLNNVYWTLAIEFQYYIAMALCFVLFINEMILLRIVAYILFFAIGYIALPNAQYHFPFHAPMFLLGIIVFQYKKNIIGFMEMMVVFFVSLVYISLTQNIEIMSICALTAAMILYFEKLKIPFLNYLGKLSYSVYLIHPIVGMAVINVLSHHANGVLQKSGVLLLGIVITFVSSYLMYLIIEKPSKNLSSKIKL